MIREAPRTFALVLILFLGIGVAAIYWLFSANLSRKNDLIQTLQSQLEAEKKKTSVPAPSEPISASNQSQQTAPTSHKHTTPAPSRIFQRSEGALSPNIVGNGNTFNIHPPVTAFYRKLTQPQKDRLEALVKGIGPHEIAFRHAQGSEDSQKFSDQLQDLIVGQAGWTLRTPKFMMQMREMYGIWILVQDAKSPPDAANKLLEALNDKDVALGARGMEVTGLAPGTFDLVVGLAEPTTKQVPPE